MYGSDNAAPRILTDICIVKSGSSDDDIEVLQAALKAVRAAGFKVDNVKDLERLREPDPYEQELIVAAEVRAYFQIAYKVRPLSPQLQCEILQYQH